MSVIEITNKAEFQKKVLKATGGVVIVDFYSQDCAPCKKLAPMLEEIANLPDYFYYTNFYKVDIDQFDVEGHDFSVEVVPTILFFNRGKVVDSIRGLPNKAKLLSKINANL